jgi:hypothetical protein
MGHPATSFELRALVGGLGEGERSRRPAALVAQHPVTEKLDAKAGRRIFPQLRVDYVMKLSEPPKALHALIVHSNGRPAVTCSGRHRRFQTSSSRNAFHRRPPGE